MSFENAVLAVLNKYEKKKFVISSGVVSEVRENDCDVEREGRSKLLNVRLNSILTNIENFVKITPKKGSYVLCATIENSETETFLLGYSEVEKYVIKINGAEFEIDGSFTFKNNQSDLKEIITGIVDGLVSAIIQTPAGPGSFSPDDIASFNAIKIKTNKLFK